MFVDDLILAMLVGLAIAAIRTKDLLGAIAITGSYSLMMALLWVRMNAVDVAFTEASVGAGISTVLMLAAVARIGRKEKDPSASVHKKSVLDKAKIRRRVAAVACALCAVALVYGAQDMPRVGDGSSPANTHPQVVKRYLDSADKADGTLGEVGPANVVTSVLGDYRGYDTFGETTVIFIAAICVVMLLRFGHGTGGSPWPFGATSNPPQLAASTPDNKQKQLHQPDETTHGRVS